MFDWVLNTPLLSVKNKDKLLYEKLYSPSLWMGFICLKATEPLRGDSLLFTTQPPKSSSYSFSQSRKDERMS